MTLPALAIGLHRYSVTTAALEFTVHTDFTTFVYQKHIHDSEQLSLQAMHAMVDPCSSGLAVR
ncbi:hypothetical protein QIS74_09736 [Colletotrichum tabaci]|uniref:Uncharacterized protein n=1 Tax=Colletotrichum tabaci TaxID=1209068 RepID=A0AAV9T639_9PEZI